MTAPRPKLAVSALLIFACTTAGAEAFDFAHPTFSVRDMKVRHAHDHRLLPGQAQSTSSCQHVRIDVTGFGNGSDALTAKDRSALRSVVRQIADEPCAVTVTGYASVSGPDALNEKLARARAENVLAYLLKLGLEADGRRIQSVGSTSNFGSEEADNRRVVVSLTSPN